MDEVEREGTEKAKGTKIHAVDIYHMIVYRKLSHTARNHRPSLESETGSGSIIEWPRLTRNIIQLPRRFLTAECV